MILPVILAGGNGTRLWPLSRTHNPKQLLALLAQETLLQTTLIRAHSIEQATAPLIICNSEYRFAVAEQARKITACTILVEQVGRNTAPAILLAALYAIQQGDDPEMLIMPSDHYLDPKHSFSDVIHTALPAVNVGKIAIFGVKPSKPHTGYGYIHAGDVIAEVGGYTVQNFVEKPNAQLAEQLLQNGDYYWNTGIFFFKASTIIREAEQHAPEILAICRHTIAEATCERDFIYLPHDTLQACASISFDYAIMEKTQAAAVFPINLVWNDLGDWASLWEASIKDGNNNAIKGNVVSSNSKSCYFLGESRMIVALGLQNVLIVETEDALLVANMECSQQIKDVIAKLPDQSLRNLSDIATGVG